MAMLLESSGLRDAISGRIEEGMPALGTCAGAILLGREIRDGRPDQRPFGAIDLVVRRNGYGRQVDSFEADLHVESWDGPFHGVFIRAPVIERCGDEVDVLASVDARPVLCRQGAIMVATFHPELGQDPRLHHLFLDLL